jgi:hypothetical protein
MLRAIIWTIEDAAAKSDWISPPSYLADCGDLTKPATLHFQDGTSLALNVPLCPNCEIELNVAEGRPATAICDGCEEEIEL